ncbi:MAG: class I SAM-dependent methyltransferase [Anaerolineae bacterium]|nr:class I SAM-dependent methyltransferase [Thermoflexales bacterium]MDW8395305.1 class I SAM-dependent methyltransferase [Anaerolineae bacterium]
MSRPALYDAFASLYDLQHRAFLDDLPLYLRLARELGSQARILEIGCGSGRLLLPLVETGYCVVGVDESPAMLEIAHKRLLDLPNVPRSRWLLVRGDARALPLAGVLDLAVIALNTFLHNLTREAQLGMLRSARRSLRTGGWLVVDLPPNDEMAWQPDDGQFRLEATIIDPADGSEIRKYVASRIFWSTQEQELTYRVETRRKASPAQEQLFTIRLRHVFRHEMELLLLQTGFGEPCWYGEYDLSPYQEGSTRMIALAQAV